MGWCSNPCAGGPVTILEKLSGLLGVGHGIQVEFYDGSWIPCATNECQRRVIKLEERHFSNSSKPLCTVYPIKGLSNYSIIVYQTTRTSTFLMIRINIENWDRLNPRDPKIYPSLKSNLNNTMVSVGVAFEEWYSRFPDTVDRAQDLGGR